MKNKNQTLGKRSITRPPEMSNSLKQSYDYQQYAGYCEIGESNPTRERQCTYADRRRVVAGEALRESAGIVPRQPIVGTRHNTSTYQHDRSDHRSNADSDAVVGAALSDRFDMKGDVASNQQCENDQNMEIAACRPSFTVTFPTRIVWSLPRYRYTCAANVRALHRSLVRLEVAEQRGLVRKG
jgi:hypothetical protein